MGFRARHRVRISRTACYRSCIVDARGVCRWPTGHPRAPNQKYPPLGVAGRQAPDQRAPSRLHALAVGDGRHEAAVRGVHLDLHVRRDRQREVERHLVAERFGALAETSTRPVTIGSADSAPGQYTANDVGGAAQCACSVALSSIFTADVRKFVMIELTSCRRRAADGSSRRPGPGNAAPTRLSPTIVKFASVQSSGAALITAWR